MLMNIKGLKRDNLKSSHTWHYCLLPANERHMTELHSLRSLVSFDYESFENCESCLLGKDDKITL